tara:strand:- start:969 stop:1199 length:231 start_codon:yes stop_codon:yes gene_type:complete
MLNFIERGMTRRHSFFCTDRQRHAQHAKVISSAPKEIVVFGQKIAGWLVTIEEPVIDKVISLNESMDEDTMLHDPE